MCEGDGREGKVAKVLQIVLWRGQSGFWHSAEQYEIEWHTEHNLASEPLQIIQVGVAIWWSSVDVRVLTEE